MPVYQGVKQDRAKLVAKPARSHQPGEQAPPTEDFTNSHMSTGFQCLIIGSPRPTSSEQLNALEQASGFLAGKYDDFRKEETSLQAQILAQLRHMGIATDTSSATKGAHASDLSPALKGQMDMWARSFENYGFASEDEARKFFSRATVTETRNAMGFFTGRPGGGGFIGFGLQVP